MHTPQYSAMNTNPIENLDPAHQTTADSPTVDWTDPNLARITRLRFVSDPGYPMWDLSYCIGLLRDGTPCRVQVPFFQVPKQNVTGTILDHARRDRVFAKGLGLLDDALSFCQ